MGGDGRGASQVTKIGGPVPRATAAGNARHGMVEILEALGWRQETRWQRGVGEWGPSTRITSEELLRHWNETRFGRVGSVGNVGPNLITKHQE